MAKFDANAAYHNVAVHPSDRFLFGMKWHGQFYIDLALPFRLCSAPFIFDSIVLLVECIVLHIYNVFYYGRSSRLTPVCAKPSVSQAALRETGSSPST